MNVETPKVPIAKHASQPARRMTTALRNSGNHSCAPPAPGAHEEVVWINFNQDKVALLKKWAASGKSTKKKNDITNVYLTANRLEDFVRAIINLDLPAQQTLAGTVVSPMASVMNSGMPSASDKPSTLGSTQPSAVDSDKRSPPEIGRRLEEFTCAAARVPFSRKKKGRRSALSPHPAQFNTARIFSLKKGVKRCYRGKLLLIPAQKSFLGTRDYRKAGALPLKTAPVQLGCVTLLMLRRLAVESIVPD